MAATVEKKQLRIATRNCGFIDPESIDDYIGVRGYEALAQALTMTPAELVEVIKASGLRGRGGAGFPTGVKWGIALANKADQKYMVCNADEGDPGAFMDRAVLEGDPHSVVEAMAVGGYAVGATQGAVYIRAEYPLAIKRLKKAIDDAKAYGLLGTNIFGSGFDFDIELKYGAGAFVCGEETALIKSMEGKRGEPVTKPPFPAQEGYWRKPTIVNNVETFANIPAIILKGADWFSSIGTATSKGTKVFALAGKITNVGLIEVPMGITLREVIFDIGGGCPDGKEFKAVQTGGPSGGALSHKDLDVAIDYESLAACKSIMGSGGMVVMDEDSCMVSVAKFFLDFTMDETCGKCTPCRIGSKRLYELLDKITKGKGTPADLDRLKNLSEIIKDTALCGLGQTMPNPILSTMDTFRGEYEAHVKDKKCPAHVCRAMLTYTIDPAKCTGCTLCSKVCPVECISGTKKQPHTIDASKCIKCGACYDKCKFDAIIKQ
ncbi:MAG: NADH-ubiquinone oxidoreductase-F iron-sulfur binding region domain-containing protein [Solidesulfovibrio sp. DCME]|uniref:NADH-ubiquinone oxidoreductase-F iron-sulfur binding region domain-containing protein n=1 Tax=Solidesulfovibrio sp. DCME TaxID=3447380 RepID=UPI003D0D64CF